MRILTVLITITAAGALSVSCAKKDEASATDTEMSQQVGDAMASVDESGGSSGSLSLMEMQGAQRAFARLIPGAYTPLKSSLSELVFPEAQAATCGASTFGSCIANQITRTFGGCTVGTATLDGTVTLTWGGGAGSCALTGNGQTVTRVPNFTLTGPRGGTLTVTKSGTNGQVITRTSAGNFTFANDGIRRVITYQNSTLYDFTSQTTGVLNITGATRAGRTLTSTSGAGLRVTNNSNQVSCTYVPNNVTWTASCSCATSGTFTASCTDGRSAIVNLTGCGTATYTVGEQTSDVTFDRCQSI